MDNLHLSGPTVTVFGQRDELGEALSDELSRRGCSTHEVTIPLGWLDSVTHAVVRLNTPTGARAFESLVSSNAPATHIVAVCEKPDDAAEADQLDELCRQCSDHHDVSLIWHPAVEVLGGDDHVAAADLAVAIADEIGHQEAWTEAPSFVSRTFEPRRHRARP